MMTVSLLIFIATLVFLVLFHEFGHYIVARIFNVAIEAFSIGFGKPLWKRRSSKYGTEFRFSPILLGGYVKFSEKDMHHSREVLYESIKPWKKILILLAGPGFNILLAWFGLVAFFKIDFYTLKPYIGSVAAHSLAEQVGFKPNQLIVSVDEQPVNTWNQVIEKLGQYQASNKIECRDGQTQERSTHRITKAMVKDKFSFFEDLGFKPFHPSLPAIIGRVLANGPADKAGLQPGDQIVKLGTQSIQSMDELIQSLNQQVSNELRIEWIRRGQRYQCVIHPDIVVVQQKRVSRLGIASKELSAFPQWYVKQQYSWQEAMVKAWQTLIFLLKTQLLGWAHFDMNTHQISGPIGMARAADEAWKVSPRSYLMYVVWINLGLAIINLFPLPVLDGGQCIIVLLQSLFPRLFNHKRHQFLMILSMMILLGLFFLGLINDWTI